MHNVICIPPGCEPRVVTIGDGYENLQALVGGTLDAGLLAENLSVMFHDEGLLLGLPPNVRTNTGTLLVGTLVVIRCDDDGDEIDTTDADLATTRAWLAESKRVGAFDYDVPPAQVVTRFEDLKPMPPVTYRHVPEKDSVA